VGRGKQPVSASRPSPPTHDIRRPAIAAGSLRARLLDIARNQLGDVAAREPRRRVRQQSRAIRLLRPRGGSVGDLLHLQVASRGDLPTARDVAVGALSHDRHRFHGLPSVCSPRSALQTRDDPSDLAITVRFPRRRDLGLLFPPVARGGGVGAGELRAQGAQAERQAGGGEAAGGPGAVHFQLPGRGTALEWLQLGGEYAGHREVAALGGVHSGRRVCAAVPLVHCLRAAGHRGFVLLQQSEVRWRRELPPCRQLVQCSGKQSANLSWFVTPWVFMLYGRVKFYMSLLAKERGLQRIRKYVNLDTILKSCVNIKVL